MITKSDFLLYLEAPLHLWAKDNNQLEKVVPTSYERHIMEQGKDIEEKKDADNRNIDIYLYCNRNYFNSFCDL